MTISTNIHNHIQAPQNNQAYFKNIFQTLYLRYFWLNYFLLTKKKRTKGAKGIISYLFSPNKRTFDVSVSQRESIEGTHLQSFLPIVNIGNIDHIKIITNFNNIFYFFKHNDASLKTFLCLSLFCMGGKHELL